MRRLLYALALSAVALPARADEATVCASAAEEGQRLMSASKLRAARTRLLVCSRDTCPPVILKDCARWLEQVTMSLPSIVVDARDRRGQDVVGVRVIADGEVLTPSFDGTALPLDPGVHVLRFEAPGAAPITERVLVREGEKNRAIAVTFGAEPPPPPPRASPPSPLPIAPIVAGAVAVAGLGLGTFFALSGISDRGSLKDSCAPRCAQSDVDAVHTKFLVADVAFGVGAAAAVVAIVLYLTAPRTAAAPSAALAF